MPDGADAKARKNINEGKGVSLGGLVKNRGRGATTYEFSTSNPMWRASLEILVSPLTTVDYSNGMIITVGTQKIIRMNQLKLQLDFYLMKLDQII